MTAAIRRDDFPVTAHWNYLDHASVAPLCKAAGEGIRDWLDDMLDNGVVHEMDWWRKVETYREKAAGLLGASAAEIAFLKNTSEGVSQVAYGLDWRPGDNVVIAAGEYPSNVYPWMHLAEHRQVELRTVPCREQRIELADLDAAIDARTRLLSISYVQFGSGFRVDLAAVGELCASRGCYLCVDAIQALGVFPIDVKSMGIDFLSSDGHKWLMGPEGSSIFFVRQGLLEKLRPLSIGWKSVVDNTNYSKIDYRLRPDASRLEAGSYNLAGLAGLGASIDFFTQLGLDAVRARIKQTTDYLVDRLQSAGAPVYSPRTGEDWSGIVSFLWPGTSPRPVMRYCKTRGIVLSVRDDRLRASPHCYNTTEEIDALIEALVAYSP